MEYPCHRCGAPVEEGTRFCAACSAPQIRVRWEAQPEAAVASIPQDPPSEPQPAAPAETAHPAETFVWRHARPAIFVAGATAGVLSALPGLSLLFPLWMALNGIAAVSIYRRRSGFSRLRRSAGAKLGALAGLVASVMYALCTTLAFVVHGTEMRAEMQRQLQIRLQAADPQAQAVFHWFLSPAGFATLIVLTLFIFLLGFVLLGAAAGAWWATTKARPKKQ